MQFQQTTFIVHCSKWQAVSSIVTQFLDWNLCKPVEWRRRRKRVFLDAWRLRGFCEYRHLAAGRWRELIFNWAHGGWRGRCLHKALDNFTAAAAVISDGVFRSCSWLTFPLGYEESVHNFKRCFFDLKFVSNSGHRLWGCCSFQVQFSVIFNPLPILYEQTLRVWTWNKYN